ncbi:ArsR/SmtB family transcription factor [Luethyella okanaganae]|uniref:ArsR/SmtB family transcription factor n=1 Tax=Luethyella okanaganae TaxID=69372 RepID=A0ABW1VGE8_9MICO
MERLTAVASVQRFRVIAELAAGPTHVSELARRVGMSRALLYLHLERLEQAGLLTGRLMLSDDGKALKVYEVEPFTITVTPESIRATVESEPRSATTRESEN